MSSTHPIDESTVEALLRARYARQRSTPEPPELELVARYVDGSVSGAERARVEALLAADPELAETVALARDAAGEQKVVSLATRRPRHRPPVSFIVAIAAALVAVVGVSLMVGQGGPTHEEAGMSGAGLGSSVPDRLLVRATAPGGEETMLTASSALPAPGATLSFEHASKLRGYAMVVELDASGARVVGGGDTAQVISASRAPVAEMAKIGDHAGCAWVVGVFSNTAFGRAEIDAGKLPEAAGAVGAGCNLPNLKERLGFARSVEVLTIHR